MQTFLVGGAVRDQLLGLEVKERDWVVVGASGEMMIEQGFRPVGKDFPVFLHPKTHEEYALARQERKTGPGYHGFAFETGREVTLEEDLCRRDLTVNAMARDKDGQLIDPFDGKGDIERKLLRHISPAFVEDPVRVLRVARFMARLAPLGFRVADETMALMRQMKARGEIDALVAERVWHELVRSLNEAEPAMFFVVLKQAEALEVIAPELESVFDGSPDSEEMARQLSRASAELKSVEIFAVLAAWCAGREVDLEGLCKRLKASSAYRRMARAASTFYALIKSGGAPFCFPTAEALLDFFEKLDLFRSPSLLHKLLNAWRFCRLPGVLDETAKAMILHHLMVAFKSLQALNMKSVVADCANGDEIKRAVHKARLETLSDVLSALEE